MSTIHLYYSLFGKVKTKLKVSFEGPLSWDEIEQGKFLLSDHNGLLSLLFIKDEELMLTSLGRVDAISIVRYLDNRVFYAGSFSGPSHLIRITANHLEILTTYPNTGPITDMIPIEGDQLADKQLVGVSGFDKVVV